MEELKQFSDILGVLAIIFIVIGIIAYNKINKNKKSESFVEHREIKTAKYKLPYYKNKYLLNQSERKLYFILNKVIDNNLIIFLKVRLADIVSVQNKYKYSRTHFNKIKSKHFDYLICSLPYLIPLIAVELDGLIHGAEMTRKKR
ncbi:MAG: DUF2726 domain-containing protein [Patescibacteria group bacterium]|nr:DUF2726 domain-containing protein [Patescibacteria group bacterium]